MVSLGAEGPDDYALIEYDGPQSAVALVEEALMGAYGLYGHLMDKRSTPLDLNYAMNGQYMKKFSPELVEGAEILKMPRKGQSSGGVP